MPTWLAVNNFYQRAVPLLTQIPDSALATLEFRPRTGGGARVRGALGEVQGPRDDQREGWGSSCPQTVAGV